MSDFFGSTRAPTLSRREFASSLGSAVALGLGSSRALAQSPSLQRPGCIQLPAIGAVRVVAVELVVNGVKFSSCALRKPAFPPLAVGIAPNNGACTLELAGGINIAAEVGLDAVAGAQPSYFGKLGFVQFTQYRHQRSPSGAVGPKSGNFACARSSGGWELDGNDPFRSYAQCAAGLNKASMADDPGVPTEDAQIAYDTVVVFPWDRFMTWLVWEETDDNRPETPANKTKRHPLARVDWAWQGKAGDKQAGGALCPSQVPHKGHGWDERDARAGVTDVLFGPKAGAPPVKFQRAHNLAWVAGAC